MMTMKIFKTKGMMKAEKPYDYTKSRHSRSTPDEQITRHLEASNKMRDVNENINLNLGRPYHIASRLFLEVKGLKTSIFSKYRIRDRYIQRYTASIDPIYLAANT